MPAVEENNDSDPEDMEQENTTPDESSEDSDSSSSSETDDSSEMDEEECDRRRDECVDDMADLERQFGDLKEQLYQERISNLMTRLEEVKLGQAEEYLRPLQELQESMHNRTQVAGILRGFQLNNTKNKYECEQKSAKENMESDKLLLYDNIKGELEEKIRRLEEDRHNLDFSADIWGERQLKPKKKADSKHTDRKKKPVSVTGPYIVYMLRDIDILEDWTAIRKARGTSARRKADHVYRTEKNPYNAKFEDGKLFYEGTWYTKGDPICIENKEDSPVEATITTINTGEVLVKRKNDGIKLKLYIAQLQKGKYTITPLC